MFSKAFLTGFTFSVLLFALSATALPLAANTIPRRAQDAKVTNEGLLRYSVNSFDEESRKLSEDSTSMLSEQEMESAQVPYNSRFFSYDAKKKKYTYKPKKIVYPKYPKYPTYPTPYY